MANAYATLKQRMEAAAGSAEKGAEVMERVAGVARRTYQSIDDTSNAYLKNHQVLTDLGYSTETQIKYQEALADALRISGASGDRAAEIQEQLSKALANGTLEGKGLNAIFENGSRLAQVLATALGVTTIQLKRMADEGKITSNVIVQALVGSLQKLQKEAAAKPTTLIESLVLLKNSMGEFVGKAAEAANAGGVVSASIAYLADHFDAVSKGALAAGAVILSTYVPGLARAAVAQLALVATNPFLLLAAAVGAATFAIAEFGDQIHPVEGQLANLQDYAAVAWDAIKQGAQVAASTVNAAFVELVKVISDVLHTGATSFEGLGAFAMRTADVIIGAFGLMYDGIVISFTKLPEAIAEAVLDAVNGLIASVEAGLNAVIKGVNAAVNAINSVGGKVGVTLGEISAVQLGRIENNFAGAGKAAGNAYIKALQDSTKHRVEDAMGEFKLKANEHAETREKQEREEKEAPSKIDSTDHPVPVHSNKDANDFEKAMREQKEKLRDLQAETAARRQFNGSLEEEEAASTRAKAAQELLNAAQHAGVEINADTLDRISKLADAYSKASSEAQALAKSQQEAAQTANELSQTSEGTFKTFVEDLAKGKSATRALEDAMAKLGEKMTDLAFNALWKSIVGENGDQNPFFHALGQVLTPTTKPVYAPGSSLPALKKDAEALKAEQVAIDAASVTINGAGESVNTSALGGHGGIGSDAVASGAAKASPYGDLSAAKEAMTGASSSLNAGGRPTADALTQHLMQTYGLTREQALGAVGTMGYESGDFKTLQERGHSGVNSGYGYAQWTGPRRQQFMDYANTNGLDPSSYAANQGFMDHELQGNYKGAITALKQTDNPTDASHAWLHSFEGMQLDGSGPGIPAVAEHAARAEQYYGQGVGLNVPSLASNGGDQANAALSAALTKSAQTVTKGFDTVDNSLSQGASGLSGALSKLATSLFGGSGGSAASMVAMIPGFADGGMINGSGSGTSDSNLAMVSRWRVHRERGRREPKRRTTRRHQFREDRQPQQVHVFDDIERREPLQPERRYQRDQRTARRSSCLTNRHACQQRPCHAARYVPAHGFAKGGDGACFNGARRCKEPLTFVSKACP